MDSLPIINQTYELYKAITDTNNQLQKRWRYGLGLSLENSTLECMESLIMAKNAPKATKIFQLHAKLAEIGRMLGGWLKATQST